ncbi:hypothetical protein [Flammeovirga agarivorans]|uniref:DUF3592 domain-containing protein n=1 Tax=Flammeovirga agarivorans TaxID=2726742 RepID=A0A7X8SRS7_9BACT|nr:hypothetical protein [Flammeovirga agarivorans]NLR95093.1 hypothetical protein [Flammeovirga agarivorans]
MKSYLENLLKWWFWSPIGYKWILYFSAIFYLFSSELYFGANSFFPFNIIGAIFIFGYLISSFLLSFHYSHLPFQKLSKSRKVYFQSVLLIGICFIPGYCTYEIVDQIRKYELQNNLGVTNSMVIDTNQKGNKVKYEFNVDGWNYKGWTSSNKHKIGDIIQVKYSKSFPALNQEQD